MKRRLALQGRYGLLLVVALVWAAWAQTVPESGGGAKSVGMLEVRGAIGPATTDYIRRGIRTAAERGYRAIVLVIDTPGGLDAATRDINQAILSAPVPVISFVYPEGARAASAGTYILYASHIAAMAPATNLGAATPVSIMGGGQPDGTRPKPVAPESDSGGNTDEEQAGAEADKPAAADSAMARKAINDSVAYIRGLAERRGRNADWAESAVRDAASLSSSKAVEQNVIDLVADTPEQLLSLVSGRTVSVAGNDVTLDVAGAAIVPIEPDWRNRLLSRITDPTVAYLLFIVGLYGLLLEGYNPGVIVPGVVGAISLLLALYAFQVLPINYAGAALIVLGIILIAAESVAPSFGALGIGGIVALVIGSIILVDAELPGYGVSRVVIGGIAGVSGLLMLLVLGALMRARRQPVVTGRDAIVGREGVAITGGRVHLLGEDWHTQDADQLQPGDPVRVTGIDGLNLIVEKLERK